jgi:hypothetical protein
VLFSESTFPLSSAFCTARAFSIKPFAKCGWIGKRSSVTQNLCGSPAGEASPDLAVRYNPSA